MKAAWKKELAVLLSSVRGEKEAGLMLGALLTPAEYEGTARRWQIMKGLIRGATQRDIRDSLKVSIATITRGSRELKYGNGIFQRFYKRLYGR